MRKIIFILIFIPIVSFSQIFEKQHQQLILRGATLINSTGAPPLGPVDIVIENNIIAIMDLMEVICLAIFLLSTPVSVCAVYLFDQDWQHWAIVNSYGMDVDPS